MIQLFTLPVFTELITATTVRSQQKFDQSEAKATKIDKKVFDLSGCTFVFGNLFWCLFWNHRQMIVTVADTAGLDAARLPAVT